jgi:hypothetical protein
MSLQNLHVSQVKIIHRIHVISCKDETPGHLAIALIYLHEAAHIIQMLPVTTRLAIHTLTLNEHYILTASITLRQFLSYQYYLIVSVAEMRMPSADSQVKLITLRTTTVVRYHY